MKHTNTKLKAKLKLTIAIIRSLAGRKSQFNQNQVPSPELSYSYIQQNINLDPRTFMLY